MLNEVCNSRWAAITTTYAHHDNLSSSILLLKLYSHLLLTLYNLILINRIFLLRNYKPQLYSAYIHLTYTTTTMANYILTEPSPSTNVFVRSGRGGYGNISRASKPTNSSTSRAVATTTTTPTAPSRRFFSGIGGAGNVHRASEQPSVSLDDEYDRIAARDQMAAGHVGIGGAGNVFHRKESDAGSDISSSSSLSSKTKLWARVSSTFSRD